MKCYANLSREDPASREDRRKGRDVEREEARGILVRLEDIREKLDREDFDGYLDDGEAMRALGRLKADVRRMAGL